MEKTDIPKDFKQGDFVKLLKAKEQMKGQEVKKESVLGAIKKYQAEDKEKPKKKKEANKEAER